MSPLKLVAVGLVAMACVFLLALTTVTTVAAIEPNTQQTQVVEQEGSLRYAVSQLHCFIYGRYMGLDSKQLIVFVNRVGKYASHPKIIYYMGYDEGSVDAAGYYLRKHHGSSANAKLETAKFFYAFHECTTLEGA